MVLVAAYGLFLIIRANRTATTMTRTNRPAIAGMKYMSAADCVKGVGVTFGAALGSLTSIYVVADDGP